MPATQKSFKTGARDKAKHSSKDVGVTKKGGAGGKGSWGSVEDDIKYAGTDEHALDREDPNFDPADSTEKGYKFKRYAPSTEKKQHFKNTMADLTTFKKKVKDACGEYLVSHDATECMTSIKELKFPLYHQDIPSILVKYALDQDDVSRQKISQLLKLLNKEDVVTNRQMEQGFQKLSATLDDLELDTPNARVILGEFISHGVAAGYLDSSGVKAMETELMEKVDNESMNKTKSGVKMAVAEYFSSNELGELRVFVNELNGNMRFEVVKQLVYQCLDLENEQREMANVALVELDIPAEQISKAVTILLNRVEDITLDCPDALYLLSCFLARMVADEVLAPAFLLRLDLADMDMGYQVAAQAQVLLDKEGAAFLERVWGVVSEEYVESQLSPKAQS